MFTAHLLHGCSSDRGPGSDAGGHECRGHCPQYGPVVCSSSRVSGRVTRTLCSFHKRALRTHIYTESLGPKLAAQSRLHGQQRSSGFCLVGNYHLHLEKTLVTQPGGNATYASGTGKELGPRPAPKGGSGLAPGESQRGFSLASQERPHSWGPRAASSVTSPCSAWRPCSVEGQRT